MSDAYEQKILNFHGYKSIVYKPSQYATPEEHIVIFQGRGECEGTLQRMLITLLNETYDRGSFGDLDRLSADHIFFQHFDVTHLHNYTDYAITIEEAIDDFVARYVLRKL